jgi:hypothetical protein
VHLAQLLVIGHQLSLLSRYDRLTHPLHKFGVLHHGSVLYRKEGIVNSAIIKFTSQRHDTYSMSIEADTFSLVRRRNLRRRCCTGCIRRGIRQVTQLGSVFDVYSRMLINH